MFVSSRAGTLHLVIYLRGEEGRNKEGKGVRRAPPEKSRVHVRMSQKFSPPKGPGSGFSYGTLVPPRAVTAGANWAQGGVGGGAVLPAVL